MEKTYKDKTVTDIIKEVDVLITAIEADDGKGVVIEVETLFDNILPCEYTRPDVKKLEDAVHILAQRGEIVIIDNSAVRRATT